MAATPTSVDDYLAGLPEAERAVLQQIRETIHRVVPEAGEKISYAIPATTLDDRAFMSFAGWKVHVSVYPIPEGDEEFERAIEPYKAGRGTLKFPLGEPIPYDLNRADRGPARRVGKRAVTYQSASVKRMMPRMFLPSSMSW
ncbi:iron chaperone [Nocardia sp. NPDC058497]|uniref:iron chaperone n=1 Tax=Nocardia sp. NPDC058497 TaxID=3346529 RepID=UPI00364DFC5E